MIKDPATLLLLGKSESANLREFTLFFLIIEALPAHKVDLEVTEKGKLSVSPLLRGQLWGMTGGSVVFYPIRQPAREQHFAHVGRQDVAGGKR